MISDDDLAVSVTNLLDYVDSAREGVEEMFHAHFDPDGAITGTTADFNRFLLQAIEGLRTATSELQGIAFTLRMEAVRQSLGAPRPAE